MANSVLSRINKRLIHGEVGGLWVGFTGAKRVLEPNDEVADDPVQQNLMEMVLAEGIAVRFWSRQKADRQNSLYRRMRHYSVQCIASQRRGVAGTRCTDRAALHIFTLR